MGAAEAVESGEQVSLLVTMFHFVPLRSRAATQKPSSSHLRKPFNQVLESPSVVAAAEHGELPAEVAEDSMKPGQSQV